MSRVDIIADIESFRSRLIKAGYMDGGSLEAIAMLMVVEQLDAIEKRLDKIENRLIELKGDS